MKSDQTYNTSGHGNQRNARVLGPHDGQILGQPGILHDRFMITGQESGGRFALVEHLLPAKALAAPLHRHSREDEYSYVLEGRVGALLGEEEVFGQAGELIFKPRGQWHTFWNAGDQPLRILEIISPGGFEEAFREIYGSGEEVDMEHMREVASRYGVEVDFEGTGPSLNEWAFIFMKKIILLFFTKFPYPYLVLSLYHQHINTGGNFRKIFTKMKVYYAVG
jgi:mannose-6-phosphate isomerase-like protein (cupin superfamily)